MTASEQPQPIDILEAVLFAAESPLEPAHLVEILGDGIDLPQVNALLEDLEKRLEEEGRPYEIRTIAGGCQFKTRAPFSPWLKRLFEGSRRRRLSPATLETLAIIAYKQPILRADVEAIRGVDCGPIVRRLLDLSLVRIVKRDESLGRPILYGTTRRFLEEFGLRSIQDLPSIHELQPGS